jgi:hypothetical protein
LNRRILPSALLSTLVLLATLCVPQIAAAATGFRDVPASYWAAADINLLAQHGILAGLPGGDFQPDGTVTRAEFAKILVLVRGLGTAAHTAETFGDVAPSSWAYPYVEAAYQAGLIQGVGARMFLPNAPVTRQDMAVMIGRTLGLAPLAQANALPLAFSDRPSIAPYAAAYVAADAKLGLMQGMPGGAFAPLADTTRAQAAAVAARLMQLPANAVSGVLAVAAQRMQLVPQQTTVNPGATMRVAAQVYGPGGAVLPLLPTFTATGGTIDSQGDFTSTTPGVATISAQIGTVKASVQVTVLDAATRVAMTGLPASLTAGTDVKIQLAVLNSQGQPATSDSGRTLLIQVQGPGSPAPLSANDSGGQATIDWKPTVAGTYQLEASAGALQPSPQVSVTVNPGSATQIALTATPSTLTAKTQRAQIQAAVEDSYGNVIPGQTTVQLTLNPPAGGSLDATQTNIEGGPSLIANFTPTGSSTQVQVQATAPALGLSGSTTIQVTIEPSVAFMTGGAQSATAGTTLSVPVQIVAPDGTPVTTDSGRSLTLTVTGPDGGTSTVTATDSGGQATFALNETLAGGYQLQAQGQGVSPGPTETVNFTAAAPAALRLWSAPTFLLAPGQTATLHAAEVDRYGNITPNAFPVVLAVTGADSGLQDTASQATAGGVVGTFVSYGPGTANIILSSPGSNLPPFQYELQVRTSSGNVVSGKGLWLRYSDVGSLGAANIVQQAKADGIDHLYVWVGSTYNNDGFMGGNLLAALLPLAHQAHISVIAWIYDTLYNPAADLQLAQQAYSYTAPSGDRADGLALDLETDSTMTPAIVGPFAQQLRQMVGPSYPLIAVTYPPQFRPHYPFATLAQTFDVLAPMDYWHVQMQPYSAAQVEAFVTASIGELRQDAGNASLPVSVIVQGYDVFASGGQGEQSPTGAEVQGAVQGAAAGGAIGVSLYEWTTATPAEWQAFLDTPGPGGN